MLPQSPMQGHCMDGCPTDGSCCRESTPDKLPDDAKKTSS